MFIESARRRWRRVAGQATVELALTLPFVVVLIVAIVQVVLLGRTVILVGNAARDGARVAAVDPDPSSVGAAVQSAPGLDPRRLRWSRGPRQPGRPVRVTVRYHAATDVPLVGPILPDPWITSTLSLFAEPDGAG